MDNTIDIYIPLNHPDFDEVQRATFLNLLQHGLVVGYGYANDFYNVFGKCEKWVVDEFIKFAKQFRFYVYDSFDVGPNHCLFRSLSADQNQEILEGH